MCNNSYFTNLGDFCFLTRWKCDFYYKEKCKDYKKIPTAKEINKILLKKKIEIKKSQIETAKRLKELHKKAYELYWQHVNPKNVEDKELKQKLIDIINSEERTNQIYD